MTIDDTVPLGDDFPLPLDRPFTRQQALEAGLTDRQLRSLVDSQRLRRPVVGVYVAAQVPDSTDLRARVIQLTAPPGAFVCDETAAWLHGATMALAPNSHLLVPRVCFFRRADEGRIRSPIAASGERTVSDDDLMMVGGVLTTTPLRTACDLGRLRKRDQAFAALDALLSLGVFTREELLAAIEKFAKQRGVRQLRWMAPLADGRSESYGESVLRLRWYDAGLPTPQLQISVVVDGRELFRLDIGLEELLFAAEYNGQQWHTSPAQVERDASRRAWLTEERDWWIEVFDKTNVHGLHQDADVRLRQAFAEVKRRRGNPTIIL